MAASASGLTCDSHNTGVTPALNPFDKLPDEMLVKVLKYLPTTSDLANASLVDKRFYRIATDPITKKDLLEKELEFCISKTLQRVHRPERLLVQNFYSDNQELLTQKYPNVSRNRIVQLLYFLIMAHRVKNKFYCSVNWFPPPNFRFPVGEEAITFINRLPNSPKKVIEGIHKDLFDDFLQENISSEHLPYYSPNAKAFYDKLPNAPINSFGKFQRLRVYLRDVAIPRNLRLKKLKRDVEDWTIKIASIPLNLIASYKAAQIGGKLAGPIGAALINSLVLLRFSSFFSSSKNELKKMIALTSMHLGPVIIKECANHFIKWPLLILSQIPFQIWSPRNAFRMSNILKSLSVSLVIPLALNIITKMNITTATSLCLGCALGLESMSNRVDFRFDDLRAHGIRHNLKEPLAMYIYAMPAFIAGKISTTIGRTFYFAKDFFMDT